MRSSGLNTAKKWLQFAIKNRNGAVESFAVIDLPKNLIDDYVTFQINHFVLREQTHKIAGLPYSNKALEEYKDVIKDACSNPRYHKVICCREANGNIIPEIVATATLKLHKRGDSCEPEYTYKTKEVNRYFEILRDWQNLYPFSDIIMDKYDVKEAFDYTTLTVHPDYGNHGVGSQMTRMGKELCGTLPVELCFAWMSSEASRRAAAKHGWVTEYKVKASEVASKLNVAFHKPPTFFTFDIYRSKMIL